MYQNKQMNKAQKKKTKKKQKTTCGTSIEWNKL